MFVWEDQIFTRSYRYQTISNRVSLLVVTLVIHISLCSRLVIVMMKKSIVISETAAISHCYVWIF